MMPPRQVSKCFIPLEKLWSISRYRSFDMRDRMAYIHQAMMFRKHSLQSEDVALFHLECEILELSLTLDPQHRRVAWFKLSYS
jgi:hypothetical protein